VMMTAMATIPPSPTRPRKQLYRIELKKPGRKTGLFVWMAVWAEPIDASFRLKEPVKRSRTSS
jgi:hypothetical protein